MNIWSSTHTDKLTILISNNQFTTSVHCISRWTKLKQSHYKLGYTKGSSIQTRNNTIYSENVEVENITRCDSNYKNHTSSKLQHSFHQLLSKLLYLNSMCNILAMPICHTCTVCRSRTLWIKVEISMVCTQFSRTFQVKCLFQEFPSLWKSLFRVFQDCTITVSQ